MPPATEAPPSPPPAIAVPPPALPRLRRPDDAVELLVVTDLAVLSDRIRGLLEGQDRVVIGAVLDGTSDPLAVIRDRAPDIVVIDALMGGGSGGVALATAIRAAGNPIPILMTTVPERPLSVSDMGIVEILEMPVDAATMMGAVERAHAAHVGTGRRGAYRSCLVYAGKGGVGKTTISHSIATCLAAREGARIALVDGAIRSGDLRLQLRVPDDAPSMLQLPATGLSAPDIERVLYHEPSGVDVLLAPPRVEEAELITEREIRTILGLLRKSYDVTVIDAPTAIDAITLALLDAVELIVSVVTPERNAVSKRQAHGRGARRRRLPALADADRPQSL